MTLEDKVVVERGRSGISVSKFFRACPSDMKDVPTRRVMTVSLDDGDF